MTEVAPDFNLVSFAIDPATNNCPVGAPLHVTLTYQVLVPVPRAMWAVSYEADIASKRQCVELVAPIRTSESQYQAGPSSTVAHAPANTCLQEGVTYRLDLRVEDMAKHIATVKEKYLLQVGILRFSLSSEDAQLGDGNKLAATVNVVCQVKKTPAGTLMRTMMNPLE